VGYLRYAEIDIDNQNSNIGHFFTGGGLVARREGSAYYHDMAIVPQPFFGIYEHDS
jgi:hypothetical protein